MSSDDLYNQRVVKFRFVVHTLGLAGWDKSRNHWSIFLILDGEKSSVRLNMFLSQGGDENGTFTMTVHSFIESNSSLMYFDYDTCDNLTVGQCLGSIQQRGRDRYRMTGTGNCCRYWVWNIFKDFAEQGYIQLSRNGETRFGERIQTRYHRNSQDQIIELPDPMAIGEFF